MSVKEYREAPSAAGDRITRAVAQVGPRAIATASLQEAGTGARVASWRGVLTISTGVVAIDLFPHFLSARYQFALPRPSLLGLWV